MACWRRFTVPSSPCPLELSPYLSRLAKTPAFMPGRVCPDQKVRIADRPDLKPLATVQAELHAIFSQMDECVGFELSGDLKVSYSVMRGGRF